MSDKPSDIRDPYWFDVRKFRPYDIMATEFFGIVAIALIALFILWCDRCRITRTDTPAATAPSPDRAQPSSPIPRP